MRAQAYADTIEDGTNKLTAAARDKAIEELGKGGDLLTFNWQSAHDAAEKLGVGARVVTDAALKNGDAIDQLSRHYAALEGDQEVFNDLMAETGLNAYDLRFALEAMVGGIQRQNDSIDQGIKLKRHEEEATDGATEATATASDAYLDKAESVMNLNSEPTDLIDLIK